MKYIIPGTSSALLPQLATMQSTDKAAYDALQKHFADLRRSSFDPGTVAAELFAKGIVGEEDEWRGRQSSDNPADRRANLVRVVMGNGGEGVFQAFLEALVKETQNKHICDQLIGERIPIPLIALSFKLLILKQHTETREVFLWTQS